jgi:hypothetical protein
MFFVFHSHETGYPSSNAKCSWGKAKDRDDDWADGSADIGAHTRQCEIRKRNLSVERKKYCD